MATLASQQDAHHDLHTQKMVLQRILFCPSEERTARELHALHPAKREQVWADMSGHKATIEYRLQAESPALLQDRLLKLEMVLQKLEEAYQQSHPDEETTSRGAPAAISFGDVDGRQAYHVARQQDASWVQAQHLKFLRCEDFDADAAAHRMMRYFAMKAYLFDYDAQIWGRDLRLSDLSQEDLESLRGGGVQCLLESDHAGRGIIFTRTRNYVYKDRKNLVRIARLGGYCSYFMFWWCCSQNHQSLTISCYFISFEPTFLQHSRRFKRNTIKRWASSLSRTMWVDIRKEDTIMNLPGK